jgi:hypothetical protein
VSKARRYVPEDRTFHNLIDVFHGFPQSIQKNAGLALQIMPQLISSIFFSNSVLTMTLPFDAL